MSQNHCIACAGHSDQGCIEKVPIFHGLTQQEMNEIAGITTSRSYSKGEIIFLAGEQVNNLYVIHQGKVKISRISEEGKEQIIRVLGEGDFIGELALFLPAPSKNSAEVIEKVTLCVINGKSIRDIIYRHPEISIKILEELSERMTNAESLIEQLSMRNVEQRVAELLLNMADHNGHITLDMSKKDLSAHIGTSQETLSRKLSYFQDLGWIKLTGQRKIHILQKDQIEKLLGR
jgi:CRP/FNR family transcriptional regulator, anaerobic regulatory protein